MVLDVGKITRKSKALSYRAYAKHRGVSTEAVSKAVRTGRITAGPDGKIDPERADREWEENTDPSKVRKKMTEDEALASPANGLPSIAQSRAIREAYEARIKKLNYEVKKGKLVNADEVRVAAFNVSRIARDKILNLPDRLAPRLDMRDMKEVHEVLSKETRLICEDLSKPDTYSNPKKVSE